MRYRSYPFVGHLITDAKTLPVAPPIAFIGREDLLPAVKGKLDAGGVVLLHGPDGVGKTTIVTALTALTVGAREGGVLWINAGEDDLGTLCDQVGLAFNERTVIDAPDLNAQIERANTLLEAQKPLVILDNAAQATVAQAFTQRVAAGLPVLLTATAAADGPWAPVAVDALGRRAAASLFYRHGGLAPGDYLNEVAAICDRLGGHPLAVELAGRLVGTDPDVTPASLLPALTGQAHAVEAVLRIAFKRLPPGEQAVFMVLGGTFAGSGTPALISAVAELQPVYVEKAINRLEARGLVRTVAIGPHLVATMHRQVYQFAHELVGSMGRLRDAEARTTAAVTDYAGRHPNKDIALRAEWGNILGALDSAAQTGSAAEVSAIAEAVANSTLLTIHGHARLRDRLALAGSGGGELPPTQPAAWPGSELMETAAQALADDDLDNAVMSYSQALQMAQQADNALMAGRALLHIGQISNRQGQHEQAVECFRQAAASAEQAQDAATLNDALAHTASTFGMMGLPQKALEAYERAIPSLEAAGQYTPLVRAYNEMGVTLAHLGRLDEAAAAHQQAIDAARVAGDREAECESLLMLGDALAQRGAFDAAEATYQEALDLGGQLGAYETDALGALGTLKLEADAPQEAVELLTRALALSREQGATDQAHVWADHLASAYQAAGQADQAVAVYRSAVELAQRIGDKSDEAGALNNLALMLTWQGRLGEAAEAYQNAVLIAREAGLPDDEATYLSNLGMVYMDMGEPAMAIDYFQQALEIARTLGDREQEVNVLGNLGVAFAAVRRWDDALACHTQALEAARETGDLHAQSQHQGHIGHIYRARDDRGEAIRAYRHALSAAYRAGDSESQAQWLYHLGGLLMDDIAYLAEAASMLNEAQQIYQRSDGAHPMLDEVQRRLKRVQARLQRASQAGLEVLPPSTPDERRGASGASNPPPTLPA